jgi:Ser/Thr protein kinase RdoA (MazF antagonist)
MSRSAEWAEHWQAGRRLHAEWEAFVSAGPADVIRCLETVGLLHLQNGRLIHALENRVFRFEHGSGGAVYVKLYRPASREQTAICDELALLADLRSAGVAAVRPLLSCPARFGTGWLCAFAGLAGEDRTNSALAEPEIETLGTLAAQIHAIGSQRRTRHRRSMHPCDYVAGGAAFLVECEYLDASVRDELGDLNARLVEKLAAECFEVIERLHGDLGLWNIIWTECGPVPIDFADMGPGPAAHDLAQLALGIGGWTSPPRDMDARRRIAQALARGYGLDAQDSRRLHTRIALTLAARRIHVSAWIASRWNDPSFRCKYPDFTDAARWRRELNWIRDEMRAAESS